MPCPAFSTVHEVLRRHGCIVAPPGGDFPATANLTDGVRDLAVAATEETSTYLFVGYVHVYSGADFSLLYDTGVGEVVGWGQRPGEPFGFEASSTYRKRTWPSASSASRASPKVIGIFLTSLPADIAS